MALTEWTWSERMGRLGGTPPEYAPRGTTLCRERDFSDQVLVLENGLCAAIKRLADGRQQCVSLCVPGDILNHEAFTLGAATVTTVALTPVGIHRLPHAQLRGLIADDEEFAYRFWRCVASQSVLAQEWMLNMGQRPAFERTAHFLCELAIRMNSGGSVDRCDFPFTQAELADLLGLSVVHVNRVLQRLRQEGYIALRRGTLEIIKWPELKALAKFDAFYLTLLDGA